MTISGGEVARLTLSEDVYVEHLSPKYLVLRDQAARVLNSCGLGGGMGGSKKARQSASTAAKRRGNSATPVTDVDLAARQMPRRLVGTLREISGQRPIDARDPVRAALLDQLRNTVASDNVAAIGIAEKIVGGERRRVLGITFYVVRKGVDVVDTIDQLIPPLLCDPQGRAIHTDIIQIGEPTAHIQATARPIRSGFSVAHDRGQAGTVGAIVEKGGRPHILSAQHVLANFDDGAAGDAICYPARGDGGTNAHRIARLLPFNALVRGAGFDNVADAALARIDPGKFGDLDLEIPGAAAPFTVGEAVGGMRVRLSGRSSVAAHAIVQTPLGEVRTRQQPSGFAGFRNHILCSALSQPGDSGAMVVAEDTGAVIGMVIGGTDQMSFVTPIRTVLAAVGARLAQ